MNTKASEGAIRKTVGFVLRALRFRESDLILTVFSAQMGKLSFLAKGARRPASRFGAALDLLTLSEFVYFNANSSLKPLREASLVRNYDRLKGDYEALSSGLRCARWLSQSLQEAQADARSFALFSRLLDTLDRDPGPASAHLYELAFKLRLLRSLGVDPQLERCLGCGGREGEMWFSPARGGLACARCRRPGDEPLSAELARGLNALLSFHWKGLSRVRLSSEALQAGEDLLDRFIAYHLHLKDGGLRRV